MLTSISQNIPVLKKVFAIFFLSLFLFNVGGYYLVYWGLKSKAQKDLLHRLDADNYSDEELIVLSIPITLPYPLQQKGFERIDGEFEYNGEYYNLVKQRIENDTLFLVCIKDHHEKKLVSVLNEYSNLTNNLPASARHTVDLFGKLFKDFFSTKSPVLSNGQGWSVEVTFAQREFDLLDHSYPVLSPPPKG